MSASLRYPKSEDRLLAQNDTYSCGAITLIHLMKALSPKSQPILGLRAKDRNLSEFVKKIELAKLIRNWSKVCCVAKSTELGEPKEDCSAEHTTGNNKEMEAQEVDAGTGNKSVQDKAVESEPVKPRAVIKGQMEEKHRNRN